MSRKAFLVVGLLASVVVSLRAVQQSAPAQTPPPTFRGGVDLMQLDVSVLDRNRRPVTGLKASDFTILEDGKPRTVETLLEINIPPVPRANAVWRNDVPQDVATNATVRDAKRIVVIVIDDISIARYAGIEAFVVAKIREVARTTIAALGPNDLAAVIHTNDNFSGQSLTTDHQRLLKAVEDSALMPSLDDGTAASGECMCNLCVPETLGNAAKALRAIPNLRKTIVFVSPGVGRPPLGSGSLGCVEYELAHTEMLRAAQEANVNINGFDPTGLRVSEAGAAAGGGAPAAFARVPNLESVEAARTAVPNAGRVVSGITPRVEYLRTLAESTGGRVVVNNNDPERRVAQVLDETRAYYLLGFQPVDLTPDGRTRKLTVRVNRRDVTVEARSGYTVPKPIGAPQPPAATSRLLPGTASEMRAAASPFAAMDGKGNVAIALGFIASPDVIDADTIALVARVTNQIDGDTKTYRQTFRFGDTTVATGQRIELLAKLPTVPGRYDVRLGVSVGEKESADVYVPVEMPDFSKNDLSISGLVLSETPSRGVPRGAIADLTPVIPTTRRTFGTTERVSAFVRVYQKDDRYLPTATVSLVNAVGHPIFETSAPLASALFGRLRASDCSFDLPLARLTPGRYLLTVQVASGKLTVKRSTTFAVEE